MERVCIYLRKSRADEELERTIGEGETLTKHRNALLKFAKNNDLNIVHIHSEVVSGESLFHRPQMLELLKEVENGLYDAVLCMDMQRLGRGDMQDQGLILRTFKDSNTKIITPQKTYDLSNDFDEEYSEFEAFMSRKELKMINRRMQGGRVRSVEEGNYIGTTPPLGYDIYFINKNRTLIPNADQAEIVKMIFNMYVNENFGTTAIATQLNSMGYKSRAGKSFDRTSIAFILKNYIYIGKVTWKKKEIKKSMDPNKITNTHTRNKSEWIITEGKHEAIINDEVFYKAQEIFKSRSIAPYSIKKGPANPLAGLIICKVCGNKLKMRKYGDGAPHLLCEKKCGNKSSKFSHIENAILKALDDYIKQYEIHLNNTIPSDRSNINIYEKQIIKLKMEIEKLQIQKKKLHDLLEQGVYDINTFHARSNIITGQLVASEQQIEILEDKIKKENKNTDYVAYLENFKNTVALYKGTKDISEKNRLMKSILIKVDYKKEKFQYDNDFEVAIFPKFLSNI